MQKVAQYAISRTLIGKKLKVSFRCPSCESELTASKGLGSPDKCPNCKADFVLDPRVLKQFLADEKAVRDEAEKLIEKQKLEKQLAREAKDQFKEKCEVCGKVQSFLNVLQRTSDGRNLCFAHYNEWEHKQRDVRWKAEQQQKLKVDAVKLSTTPTLEGYRITRYLTVDGVEYVVGTGVFSELVTEVVDFVGARSTMFEGKLRKGRLQAMKMMQLLAVHHGANAVVGIDLDYSTFSSNRTAIIANGTFVVVEPVDDAS